MTADPRACRSEARVVRSLTIAGYANWFAVDPLCAVMELRMLGVKIDPQRENEIKASIEAGCPPQKFDLRRLA